MSSRRTEPASALLMAALAASLLAAAAGLLVLQTRSARAASAESYRFERARLDADALLETAIVRLDSGDPMPARGVLFGDAGGSVRRQDTTGLVDINVAEPDQIQALLASVGVNPDRSALLADRIADWRDGDDLRRLHGAEREEYRSAHVDGPANHPFQIESELASVLGMEAELAHCIAPLVTTYSGQSVIDVQAAPDQLRSLPHTNDAIGLEGPPIGRVILLTAEAPISSRAMVRMRRWIRLTGDSNRPVITHRAAEDLASVEAREANVSCVEHVAA